MDSAVRHLVSSCFGKRTQRGSLEAPRPKACPRLLERDNADYLHGGEVPWSIKLELHFNRARAEALVLPAHIVIAWPHTVLVALREIVQSQHTVRQLAQTTVQVPSKKEPTVR